MPDRDGSSQGGGTRKGWLAIFQLVSDNSLTREETSSMLDRLFRRERGQGLVEYALIIALVAVVVIGTLVLLGPQISNIFQSISNNL